MSFEQDKLDANFRAVLDEIQRAKPASAKGRYLRKITVSSTMGPGVRVDTNRLKPDQTDSNAVGRLLGPSGVRYGSERPYISGCSPKTAGPIPRGAENGFAPPAEVHAPSSNGSPFLVVLALHASHEYEREEVCTE